MTVIAATSGDKRQVVLGKDPEAEAGLLMHMWRLPFCTKVDERRVINCKDKKQTWMILQQTNFYMPVFGFKKNKVLSCYTHKLKKHNPTQKILEALILLR